MTKSPVRIPRSVVEFILTSAGFGAALFIYDALFLGGLTSDERLLGSGASILAFWCAVQIKQDRDAADSSAGVLFLEQFSFGAGVNLLLHAVLTYAFQVRRTPFLVVFGSLLSAALVAVYRKRMFDQERAEARVVLVGFDSVAARIVHAIKPGLIGVVADSAEDLPANLRLLGGLSRLESIIDDTSPTRLVVGLEAWDRFVSPAFLLRCRLNGTIVEDAPAVYERVFSKVCCERLQPMDLLLSSSLRGDSRTIAIQAVYNNLFGLFFLAVLSPAMLLSATIVSLFSGEGPVLESIECAGFQYIPFRLQRFRTTRRNGSPTVAGLLLRRLRLVDLPQLINVVRGDMALAGPRPVRREFAEYLTEAMPFYSHRFSVKPGIVGWAGLHSSRALPLNETARIEYDLYYVKRGSLWLDAEILLDTVLGRRSDAAGSAS